MGRHLDKLLEEMAQRPKRRHERRRRPRRKRAKTREEQILESLKRKLKGPPPNPLADPVAGIKRPLRALNGAFPGAAYVEFSPGDVTEIRLRFHATQRRFARMIGISVGTLRNWEQGRRLPHGPARALLRVAAANPNAVAEVLLRFRRAWWME